MKRTTLILMGIIVLIPAGLLVLWHVQGRQMKPQFVQALRSGEVGGLHRDLQEHVWTQKELAGAEVMLVPEGAGMERSLARHAQTSGRVFVSPHQYSYQATIRDDETEIVHVFGFRRREPQGWQWEKFHPTSMHQHLSRRQEQLDAMKQQPAR